MTYRLVPKFLCLPPEVFSTIASFLAASKIWQLSDVCRSICAEVARWDRNKSHPMHSVLHFAGVYWFRSDGVFYTERCDDVDSLTTPLAISFEFDRFRSQLQDEDSIYLQHEDPNLVLHRLLFHRTHCATVTVGRSVYRLGGRVDDARLRSCFRMDLIERVAKPLPSMLWHRSACAAATIGSRIYVMGGYDGHQELNTMEVFDTATQSWLLWNTVAAEWCVPHPSLCDAARTYTMPIGVCEHSVVSIARRYILLLGGCTRRGRDDEASLASVWLVDTWANTWTQLHDMVHDRILGCAVYNCVCGNDNLTHHTVLYYGGQSLKRPRRSEETSFVLRWTSTVETPDSPDGGFLVAIKDAEWAYSGILGGHTELNTVALQHNHDVAPRAGTQFGHVFIVDGDYGYCVGHEDGSPHMAWLQASDALADFERGSVVTAVCSLE